MDVACVKRTDSEWAGVALTAYMSRLYSLAWGTEWFVRELPEFVDSLILPAYQVRDMYRRGSYHSRLNSYSGTPVMHYVMGCLGHNVSREIRKHPRLCALWSAVHVGGRWREVEDVISGDHLAMYLYSRHVVCGRLPAEMHNRMVLESYLCVTAPMRAYFDGVSS